MEHNILNVRREGEFYYPIYFEEDFAELCSGLKKRKPGGQKGLYCIRFQCIPPIWR